MVAAGKHAVKQSAGVHTCTQACTAHASATSSGSLQQPAKEHAMLRCFTAKGHTCCGISEVPPNIHCLMIAVQHIQFAALLVCLLLQPF